MRYGPIIKTRNSCGKKNSHFSKKMGKIISTKFAIVKKETLHLIFLCSYYFYYADDASFLLYNNNILLIFQI